MASVQEKAHFILWLAETKPPVTVQRIFKVQYGKNPPEVKLKFICSNVYSVLLLKY
jgi:hypothetical protein